MKPQQLFAANSNHRYAQNFSHGLFTFRVLIYSALLFPSYTFSQSPDSSFQNELRIEAPPPQILKPAPINSEFIDFISITPAFQYVVYSAKGHYNFLADQQDNVRTHFIGANGYFSTGFDVDLHNDLLQKGNLRFFLLDSEKKKNGSPLISIQHNDFLALKAHVADKTSLIELPYEPETFVVVPLGISEEFKKQLEAKTGIPAPGRVACFHLDKLSRVLDMNEDDLTRIRVVKKE